MSDGLWERLLAQGENDCRELPADASALSGHARELRTTALRTGEESIAGVSLHYDEPQGAGAFLQTIGTCTTGAIALILASWGEGLSTLALRHVGQLCESHRRDPQQARPLYIDLGRLVDHDGEHVPATLNETVQLELARRQLPDDPAPVLQAVSEGRCVLFLDHVEAVAAHHPGVWHWPAELDDGDRARGKPHVVMLCADELFDDDDDVRAAALTLRESSAAMAADLWFATLVPLDWQAAFDACTAAGIDLGTCAERHRAWQWTGLDGRATAARLAALSPLFNQRRDQALQPIEVFTVWWTHCLPPSFDLEAATFVATAMDLARLQGDEQANAVPNEQFAALVEHLWPQASPAQQTLLRMSLRVALQMQRNGRHVSVPSGLLWSGQAVIDALMAGDLELIGAAIVSGWRGTGVADAAVEAWQRAGHTTFPPELHTALQDEQPPAVTGALLRLSCQLARTLAGCQARTSAAAAGTRDIDARYRSCLQDMLAPLSQSRLAGASLRGAHLRELPLTDLDLRRADLTGADFTGARLRRVVLDDAVADEACFERAELDDVSAERLRAHRTRWQHARWNRRWANAELTHATPDMRPDTADAPVRLTSFPGASPSSPKRLLRSVGGHWLAALLDDGGVAMWRGDTLTPVWHLPAPDAGSQVLDAAFSDDGNHLVTTHAHKALRRWTSNEGHLTQEYTDLHVPMHMLMVHPEGGPIVGYGGQQHAWCSCELQRLTHMPSSVPAGSAQGLTCATLAPSGRSVFANASSGPGVWEYAPAGSRRVLDWPVEQVWALATAHDSAGGHAWLAALESDALWLGNADTTEPPLRFDRPGAVVASLTHRAGQPPAWRPSGPMDQLAFSPDGRWLACIGPGGPAMAVDTRSGKAHPLHTASSEGARCVGFDRAGQLVLGSAGLRTCPLPDPVGASRP